MAANNSVSEWYRILWEKLDKEIKWHSKRLRQNKEMLINKWADFYSKKYKNKYKFKWINYVKEYLNENINWFCDYLDDDTFNEDPYADDFIIDFKKDDIIGKFWNDFHEIVYDLEEYDPVVEAEKFRNQSKTKSVKNKFIAKLINALNTIRKK